MSSNKGHKAEVESVEFKPATGGVVSETRTKVKRGGQGGGPDYDYEHEQGIHPTIEHAAAHLKKTMGHCFGQSEGAGASSEAAPPEGAD